MKQFFFTFLLLFFIQKIYSQTTIIQSKKDLKYKIVVDSNYGKIENSIYQNNNYNYQEVDSLGKIIVLGNLNKKHKPVGSWIFFLGDINLNGKEDSFSGKVKNGFLNGVWTYSYICIRVFNKGKEINASPCPNI